MKQSLLSISPIFSRPNKQRICAKCLKQNCSCDRNLLGFLNKTQKKNTNFRILPSQTYLYSEYSNDFSEKLFSRRGSGKKSKSVSPKKVKGGFKMKPRPQIKQANKGGKPLKTGMQGRVKPKTFRTQPKSGFQQKQIMKGKTTPFGGFGSAQAQKDALKKEFEKNLQENPEFFPESLQDVAVDKGFLSPELEQQIETGAGAGKISLDPLVDARYGFERLYPKQTLQLIKLGQDTTLLGRKLTEVDQRVNTYNDTYWNKFKDYDSKFIDLGRSVTDASKTATDAKSSSGFSLPFGISTGMAIVGVGVLALVLVLNRNR